MAALDLISISGTATGNFPVNAYLTPNSAFSPANGTLLDSSSSASTSDGDGRNFRLQFTLNEAQTTQFAAGSSYIVVYNSNESGQYIFDNNGFRSSAGSGLSSVAFSQTLYNTMGPAGSTGATGATGPAGAAGATGPSSGVTFTITDNVNTFYGTAADDNVSLASGNDLIFGYEGADTINAGTGNNTIVGGRDSNDGADFITAGGGNDLIYGNGGNDTISTTGGNDIVAGGFGNDLITLGAGNDIVFANQDNDTIDAGDGANLIFGGFGNDYVKSGSGNDTLYGNEGNDTLMGGAGADRYVFNPGDGADLVLGFSQAEGDRLALMGQTVTSTQDVNGSAVLTLSGGGTITLSGIMANQVNSGFYA